MIQPNREELAWAAGFFDGEGNCRKKTPYRRDPQAKQIPLLSISQTDRRVLDRFKAAVFGVGKVYGPYRPKTPRSRPYWSYTTSNFGAALAVVAALWPFLGEVKRQQISAAFKQYYNTPKRKTGPKRKEATAG